MKRKFFALFLVICTFLTASCAGKTHIPDENKSLEQKQTVVAPTHASDSSAESAASPVTVETGILSEKSPEEKREINIFLSNFSETSYNPGITGWSAEEEKINFAFYHAKYNSPSLTFMRENSGSYYEGISAKNVDSILNRFFGSTVPHKTPEDSNFWTYENGDFVSPFCEGDGYMAFSIATAMHSNEDGTYNVEFDIFPYMRQSDVADIDKAVYSYTPEQAAAEYTASGGGIAVVRPKVYNGKNTYELVDYKINR